MRKIFVSAIVVLSAILAFGNVFAASDVESRVTVLEGKVATLEQTVTSQQTTIQNLQSSLQAAIDALEDRMTAVEGNPAVQIGLLGYMRLDTNERNGVIGPHVIFEGVNLHLQNGAGESVNSGEDLPNGLGNLIVGYDEVDTNPNEQLNPGDRSGSHNLVIGWGNEFPNISSIVHGYRNTANGMFSAVIAGWKNNVASYSAIISGSENLLESNDSSAIIGGSRNVMEYLNNNLVLMGGYNNIMPNYSPYRVLIGGPSMIIP